MSTDDTTRTEPETAPDLEAAPVSTVDTEHAPEAGSLAAVATTVPMGNDLGSYFTTYWRRVRGGDTGSLPAVAALVVLFVIFSVVENGFYSLNNFANLITQAGPGILLAMGLVFVLLLGEIDLAAGTTSGVGGALIAVLLLKGVPMPVTILIGLLAGVVIGLITGVMRAKLRVPSFVISLALFLGLQGVVILIVNSANTQGNLTLQSNALLALENSNMPVWLGWVLAVVCIAGFAIQKVVAVSARRRKGLATEPMVIVGLKVLALAIIALVITFLMNKNRATQQGTIIAPDANGNLVKTTAPPLQGMAWIVLLVLVLTVVLGFVLTKTRYGRHVYAVGGNDEAARRAGIRVDAIRISVFVIGSALAVISGIALASQTGVNYAQGAGNTLLLAVGAAVVGGTSLFGGKGKITDAVIGGFVVAVIVNGMADLLQGKNNAAYQAIVTGVVLALAATVDAVSRRRSGASGLG